TAIARKDGPTELVLSRQKVAELPPHRAEDAMRGGYVLLREQNGPPDYVMMATGSEVGVAVDAANELQKAQKRVRVVSLPCLEVFSRQDDGYRNSVLPKEGVRVSIEAGRTDLWRGWVGPSGITIGIDHFGASAPAKVIAEKLGFTGPQVAARILGVKNV